MATAPSSRLRLTPSNSSLLQNAKATGRYRTHEPRLSLKRVAGTTCTSPLGFDTAGRCFAYAAGGAVVVVDGLGADGEETYTQRFYRARPAAVPVFTVPPIPQSSHTTPRANDARRVAKSARGSPDWSDSSSSRTWTSRERIKAATCVSLSRDGRFLAVGETGYAPRVLIFSLRDSSSDTPLVSISEHGFGVRAVAWSEDGRFLASLGTANDGFLFVWRVDPRNGSARLFQQNRCTSYIAGMIWLGSNLITFGTRHVKSWRVVDDSQGPPSPSKRHETPPNIAKKTLPGRNVLLGPLLEATFTCATPLAENHALLCSDGGDICVLDDTTGQMRLTRAAGLGSAITCCARRGTSAFVGDRDGQLASLDVGELTSCAEDAALSPGESGSSTVFAAMGFADDQLVTIDADRSIDIWNAGIMPCAARSARIQLPGQSEPVLGIQSLARSGVSFFTWSASGRVLLWDIDGRIRESFDIAVEDVYTGNDVEPRNQLCVVRADEDGQIFAAGDRVGVLRIVDYTTGEPLLETKAHTSEIDHIAVYHAAAKASVATSGRDRTVQIYHRPPGGSFALLQTLEFPSRVTDLLLSSDDKIIICSMDRNIQVHELVSREGDTDAVAAIQCRSIALKASPVSMALDASCRSLFVSSLDRTVHHFDVDSGRALISFKCTDENGTETAVLDSLVFGSSDGDEPSILLGLSNTDKSVRIYDSASGVFIDREWGHTESINGVALVDGVDETRRVVSVGCDGTIMIWDVDLRDLALGATSRSPSPAKESPAGTGRPPLRRVLSKAELAEFQRPSSSHGGRRSPPPSRSLRTRKSRNNLSSSSMASARTPTTSSFHQNSPPDSLADRTPSRRASSNRSGSPAPDISPRAARLRRKSSMPALGSTPPAPQTMRKKSSAVSLRSAYGFGSLQMASEQTCRQLRAYRKKLSSSEPITEETTAELETELRLTAVAISERANRSRQAITEPMLSGLLDHYSEKLVSMLDEKLRLRLEGRTDVNTRVATEDGLALLRLAADGEKT